MRKVRGILCVMLCLLMAACAEKDKGGNTDNTAQTTETINDTSEETDASKETETPSQAADDGEEIWVMDEAPVIRNALSEEEKANGWNKILEQGTFLFSGQENEGYYPDDVSWLSEAENTDAVVLIYACEDVTHGGWGVLGMSVQAGGGNSVQKDIAASSDEPQKERLVVFSVEEILQIASAGKTEDITSFSLGAWNGGRIAALYYLPEAVAAELNDYLAEIEEYEQIIHTYQGELSNENAIENAQIVYAYLKEIYGSACLTGQMESTWMGSADYEMDYIESATGKLPAIRGLDGGYAGNSRPAPSGAGDGFMNIPDGIDEELPFN